MRTLASHPDMTTNIDELELHEAREEAKRLQWLLDHKTRELAAQKRREDEILQSTSWRITAPLRAIVTKLRGRGAAPAVSEEEVSPQACAGGITADIGDENGVDRAKRLLPGIPEACINKAEGGPAHGNDAYRLLDFENVMSTLLGDDTIQLLNHPAAESQSEHYVGSRSDPPRIAFLGSEELLRELAFDARVTPITENRWRENLAPGRFAFALVETVWHVNNREWRYSLTAEGRGRPTVESLLRHCHEIGLPVAVWFREDVSNYASFAWLGRHADRIYAVDAPLAERLRSDYPDACVEVLPVAVQPALYNPIRPRPLLKPSSNLRSRILFDGWWELIEGAADSELLSTLRPDIVAIESEWEFGGIQLTGCPDFRDQTVGCVRPLDRAALGKMFGIELFRESSLIPRWRQDLMMLRSAACGTVAVQAGTRNQFIPDLPHTGDGAALADSVKKMLADPLQRARHSQRVFRQVLASHCLADRLQCISEGLGLDQQFVEPPPRIACLLVTMRPHLLPSCLQRFRENLYPNKELIIVVHDRNCDLRAARELVRPGEPIRFFQLGREHSLGACLNFAFAQTDASYWTKMDDDDLYGPHYLSDLMLYRRTGDVSVFGKPAAFIYFEADDELHWLPIRGEQQSLQMRQPGEAVAPIAGGTISGRREVLETVPFSERRRRGSDSDFLNRCHESGYATLATDYFNFARFRSKHKGFHTWDINEEGVRSNSAQVTSLAKASSNVFV